MDLNLLRRMAGIPTEETKTVNSNSSANEFRRLAGLNPLPIKEEPVENSEEDKEETEELPAEELPAEENSVEKEIPDIVSSIAAQAEGKSKEELADLIKQVYDAGVADGMEKAKEVTPEEEPEEEELKTAPEEQSTETTEEPEDEEELKDDVKMSEESSPVSQEVQTEKTTISFDLFRFAENLTK